MGKCFLYLMRRAPYGGVRVRETIDMLLTTAAFDQRTRVLFLDDGVYQLLPGQQPQGGRKSVASLLGALEVYGVDDVLVESESLRERGIGHHELLIPARLVARADVADLLDKADVVVGC